MAAGEEKKPVHKAVETCVEVAAKAVMAGRHSGEWLMTQQRAGLAQLRVALDGVKESEALQLRPPGSGQAQLIAARKMLLDLDKHGALSSLPAPLVMAAVFLSLRVVAGTSRCLDTLLRNLVRPQSWTAGVALLASVAPGYSLTYHYREAIFHAVPLPAALFKRLAEALAGRQELQLPDVALVSAWVQSLSRLPPLYWCTASMSGAVSLHILTDMTSALIQQVLRMRLRTLVPFTALAAAVVRMDKGPERRQAVREKTALLALAAKQQAHRGLLLAGEACRIAIQRSQVAYHHCKMLAARVAARAGPMAQDALAQALLAFAHAKDAALRAKVKLVSFLAAASAAAAERKRQADRARTRRIDMSHHREGSEKDDVAVAPASAADVAAGVEASVPPSDSAQSHAADTSPPLFRGSPSPTSSY
eukprot:TRINITY_DN24991_c0_g3_i1.p1 TRINITY_DN24991_c0_g3~~TRINITY_DN24991_c0_g3_i1.p1  ORF type:complete len:443 (-),score=79.93 TRINITY_DN24991_c0_g3_i1:89-1348(-)